MARLTVVAALLAIVAALVLSCDRAASDQGLDAALRVAGAQFFRDAMPADEAGPKVRSVTVGTKFSAGVVGRSCVGEMDREAKAVAIAIVGDLGYWILPAGVPSSAAIDAPTFNAELSFASSMQPGKRVLVVRAVDAAGHFGPPASKSLEITERGVPEGQLVISLTWDNEANLDLHVVDPRGVEIFKRNINSYEGSPPGGPREAPGTTHDGGVLDIDSHAECVPDGRHAENVVWTDTPPKGRYVVRVDTFSLCGEPVARWRVQAILNGLRIGAAEGVATEVDTRRAHNRGAGVLALEVDVP